MRLGLFGGTFDPIHIAHLIVAEWVREEMGLDRVLFVPAALPPHKTDRMLSPAWQRLAMVRLATAGSPWFEASDLEIRRGGVSYTIETVRALRQQYKLQPHELFLIIGSDSLKDMGSWREPESIFAESAVVVVPRPGFDPSEAPPQFASKATLIAAPLVEISSSEIRERVRSGKSIRYLVPPGVERLINEHGLYRHPSEVTSREQGDGEG
ncbi:MAG: nicotinate-nucleotide adenylyltransferase [candidate division KSB1 bacterium]|nr:nicotinate-nucleotide adenylyltransferase [candidate division KSB1 bacterium]MDZ7385004.1 nicotinate-nucleotide adenylyltransferase [candidate division KSB1 bacterium]